MVGGWVGHNTAGQLCPHHPTGTGLVCNHCAPTGLIGSGSGGGTVYTVASGGAHTHSMGERFAPDPSGVLVGMLRSRLRMDPSKDFPFRAMYLVDTGEHVHLFIVPDKDPVVLTDESQLYPSDQLMTQIRLLLT